MGTPGGGDGWTIHKIFYGGTKHEKLLWSRMDEKSSLDKEKKDEMHLLTKRQSDESHYFFKPSLMNAQTANAI